MKREGKSQGKVQNRQSQPQQQNQFGTSIQSQSQHQHNKQQSKGDGDSLNFIEDIKKRGWRGEQLFSFNKTSSSGLSAENGGSTLVGQIKYDNYTVCSASLISQHCLLSITQIQLKLRSQSLKFYLAEQQSYDIESYEQKEIENYNILVFKLKQSLGDKLGYFGVITYLDRIFYEQFDLQNKKKTISIPFYLKQQQQYITDIADDLAILMKNKSSNSIEEDVVEFLGLPLITNDPFLGLFIIGLVVKSSTTSFKAILLQQSHLQFLRKFITNQDDSEIENMAKEDTSVLTSIQKLESRVIYQSNGDLAHKDGIYTLCRLNNSCLASSSVDKSIRVWDWKGQTLLNNLDCDGCCRYFVCEDNMLVGTSENYVIIIDWHSRKIEGVIPCKNKLYSLLIYKHKTIFAGDCYGNINIINNSNLMYFIRNHEENPRGHRGSVNVMHKINAMPNLFFTAGEFGEIKVWDTEKFELKGEMLGHEKEKSVYYLESYKALDSNSGEQQQNEKEGNYFLISGSSDKTIRIWNVQTLQQIKIIQMINPIYSACMINSSEIVIGDGNCIRIMNIQKESESVTISKHSSRVNAICKLSQTSFASGDIEGSIITWSLKKPAILIQDGGDPSPASSSYQDFNQNTSQLQHPKQQQPVSPKDVQNLFQNKPTITHTPQPSSSTITKVKPTIINEEQGNENQLQQKKQQKPQSQIASNQSPILTALPGPPPPPQAPQLQNNSNKMIINDVQFPNPYIENHNQYSKGNSYGSLTSNKMNSNSNNNNKPQSTQNARQPPQQKLNVEFFKEDPQNNNPELERGRQKVYQLSSTSPHSQNQNSHYNDKSPQAYKRNLIQQNQQQQNNRIITNQNDQVKPIENHHPQINFQSLANSAQNQLIVQDLILNNSTSVQQGNHIHQASSNIQNQNQQVQDLNPSELAQNGFKNSNVINSNQFNTHQLHNDQYNTNQFNSNIFNTIQSNLGQIINTSELNSSKFQNLNQSSFIDLLKQFDNNDKYQIIHQKKLGVNTSPLQSSINITITNSSSQMPQNSKQNKQVNIRDPLSRNQELKDLQQHYDMLIEQYLSSQSNKNQPPPPLKKKEQNENDFDQLKNGQNKQMVNDIEIIDREHEIAQKLIYPDQTDQSKIQKYFTNKNNSTKQQQQLKQEENIIEFEIKENDTSYMKSFSNNQGISPTNQTKPHERREEKTKEEQEEEEEEEEDLAVKQNGQYHLIKKQQSNYNRQEENDLIEKLNSENKELKNQVSAQNQQIEKYQSQIQILIETLQRSEDERIQIVNEIKQITPQLSRYSEITSSLMEKSETQTLLIKKQDEEIHNLKDYIIDLQNENKKLKQEDNRGYEEEISLNPIQQNMVREQEEKLTALISPLSQQTEPIKINMSSEEQNPYKYINNFIHISEFSSIDECPQNQYQQQISSPSTIKKIHQNLFTPQQHHHHHNDQQPQEQQQNESLLSVDQHSPQLQNREKIMAQLRILQQEALKLHKQMMMLKSQTSECTNETDMISLLNELQQTHSHYQMKSDEITELKTLYNLF